MKVFLIVILSLTALLCTNIVFSATVDADGNYKHKLRWLFIPLHSLPTAAENKKFQVKNKRVKKDSRQNKKKETDVKDKPEFKLKSLSALKELIGNAVPFLEEVFGGLIGTIRVKKLHLNITVAGEDSAQTAIQYGRISAVCSNALSRLDNVMKLKDTVVNVDPDFIGNKTKIYLDTKIKIRIISVLAVLFRNLFKGFNIYEQAMQTFMRKEEKQNEPARN